MDAGGVVVAQEQVQVVPEQVVFEPPPPTNVLRLRGLPYQATKADVVEFFAGLNTLSILISTRNGRATGEAYVEFGTTEEAVSALQTHNRQNMGRRYIELFQSTIEDMQNAGQHNNMKGGKGALLEAPAGMVIPGRTDMRYTGVVRMRGLPYSATTQDIEGFFVDLEIVPEGILITCTHDGRPTGEAYVEFATEEGQQAAMAHHRERMGQRYIELFQATKGDMVMKMQQRSGGGGASQAQQQLQQQQSWGMQGGAGDGLCLKMRGLPYSAGVHEIAQFFEGFSIAPNGIHICVRNDRPTGEAYVEFVSADEAARAREARNRQNMGPRYVELFRASRQEMANTVWAQGGSMPPPPQPAQPQQMMAVQDLAPNAQLMQMMISPQMAQSHAALALDPTAGMGGAFGMGIGGLMGLQQWGGSPAGMGMGMGAAGMGGLGMGMGIGGGRDAGAMQGGAYQQPQSATQAVPAGANGSAQVPGGGEYANPAGNSVRMRGLPYHVGPNEVVQFFVGYQIIPETVRMGQNQSGRATGEAWVAFASPQEAQRAVAEKNREMMGSRYIELFLS